MSELLVYKASAGSGKTFTLAVEYIKLLIFNPRAYRQILAVTFTNKATAEMKERILSQLYGIQIGDKDSEAYLNRIKEETGKTEQEIREAAGIALSYMLHDYSRFRVETIDSFFQSVMRNLARELELSPGNFGQISLYDAVRRETYRDFADQIGITSRTLIQGLYGVSPDALNGKLVIRPGFPMAWDKASMSMADLAYEFLRKGDMDIYNVTQRFKEPLALTLQVNAVKDKIRLVKVNGKAVKWKTEEAANGYPLIVVSVPAVTKAEIEIQWEGNVLQQIANDEIVTTLEGQVDLNAPQGISFLKVYDPQNVLVTKKVNTTKLSSKVNKDKKGHHTFFVYTRQGNMEWWQPVNVYVNVPQVVYNGFENIETGKCRVLNMDKQFNSSVADIFKNEYLSPRSPYTTLQLPTQGIGEWCHPLLTAEIDDSGLRSLVKDNMYKTSLGIPFRVMKEGNNIAYTSLWDNYPDMVKVPLSGKASHAYLLLVGSTNHMQCRIANGIVRVYYTDGTSEVLELVNPDNWCPIEQDFYLDDFAFDAPRPRPYRFHLKTGIVSRDLGKALKLRGSADRRFEGGAGVMLDIPLDKNKTLKELTLETVANDVVIGLMSVTLQ